MTTTFSFPKERIKVLLLENVHAAGLAAFQSEHYQVETIPGSLSEAELIERLPEVSILGIRSRTQITAKALAAAPHLLSIGAFCIGTNQIDLPAASLAGVAVFNAPYSNTRSVVELALGEIIMLMRHTFERTTEMQAGIWKKTSAGSYEVRGKRLGIVGYGNIGSQLSVVAEALGMEVIFYDIDDKLAYGNAKRLDSLEELLAASDVVSLHVDGRPGNAGMIGAEQLALMRPGSLFLNLSRGFVVDETAVAAALRRGHLAGAALDVYSAEPDSGQPFESALRGIPNVILTPHVASGTLEAQQNIGEFVADKVISFINSGNTTLSVNLPGLLLPAQSGHHRLIHIHHNEPGVLARINAILADTGANISGQFLGTNQQVGYVITDIEKTYSREVKGALAKLPETIRVRLLY